MGKLADEVKKRSKFIKIEIGESSEPMVYRGAQPIVGKFGDSFRYAFDVETEEGFVTKTFDNRNSKLALAFDEIAFGTKVIIHRKQMYDENKAIVEGKSIYEVEIVK